jgi:nucleoside-diphosphate-sugar epimerase
MLADRMLSAADLDQMLESTRDVQRQLDATRVLITGGTGFFGRWLLESWADSTDRLHLRRVATVVSRDVDAFRRTAPRLAAHPSIELLQGDVLGPQPVSGSFDACIHAATAASLALSQSRPRLMFDTVLTGTANVLDWVAGSGDIPMLLTSSGAVYGPQDPSVYGVPEGHLSGPDPLDPVAVYAEAKRAAEMLCAVSTSSSGTQVKIARCFAFVGPHLPLDAHFAIGNFIRDGLRGNPIALSGDGTAVRSYMYPTDLITWLWTILVRGRPLRAYNVGSPHAHDLRTVAHLVASRCGDVDVRVGAEPTAGRPASRYVPDITRATTELDLGVQVPVDDAVDRTLAWHRAP